MKKNLMTILGWGALKTITQISINAFGVPSGVGNIIVEVLNKMGLNLGTKALMDIAEKGQSNIIKLFSSKIKVDPKNDLLIAFISSILKSLDEIFDSYISSNNINLNDKNILKNNLNQIKKEISNATWVKDLNDEDFIFLKESEYLDLFYDTLRDVFKDHKFEVYFRKHYEDFINKNFLEELKRNPNAQVMFYVFGFKDLKDNFEKMTSNIDIRFSNLENNLNKIANSILLLNTHNYETLVNNLNDPDVQDFFRFTDGSINEKLFLISEQQQSILSAINSTREEIIKAINDKVEHQISYKPIIQYVDTNLVVPVGLKYQTEVVIIPPLPGILSRALWVGTRCFAEGCPKWHVKPGEWVKSGQDCYSFNIPYFWNEYFPKYFAKCELKVKSSINGLMLCAAYAFSEEIYNYNDDVIDYSKINNLDIKAAKGLVIAVPKSEYIPEEADLSFKSFCEYLWSFRKKIFFQDKEISDQFEFTDEKIDRILNSISNAPIIKAPIHEYEQHIENLWQFNVPLDSIYELRNAIDRSKKMYK